MAESGHLSLRSLRLPLVLGLERLDGRLLRLQPLRIQLLQSGQVRSGLQEHHLLFSLLTSKASRCLAISPSRRLDNSYMHTYTHT